MAVRWAVCALPSASCAVACAVSAVCWAALATPCATFAFLSSVAGALALPVTVALWSAMRTVTSSPAWHAMSRAHGVGSAFCPICTHAVPSGSTLDTVPTTTQSVDVSLPRTASTKSLSSPDVKPITRSLPSRPQSRHDRS